MSRKCFVRLFAGVLLLILLLSMAGCNTNQEQETAEADQRYDAPEPIPETKDEPQLVVEDTPENDSTAEKNAASKDTSSLKDDTIDPIALAKELGRSKYGDIFDHFVCTQCAKREGGGWRVDFESRYGADGFVKGPSVVIDVNRWGDGGKAILSPMNRHDYFDFDPSLLESITEEMVINDIKKQISPSATYEISDIRLIQENGQYALDVSVVFTSSETFIKSIRYEL